jgi:hypothetical protein
MTAFAKRSNYYKLTIRQTTCEKFHRINSGGTERVAEEKQLYFQCGGEITTKRDIELLPLSMGGLNSKVLSRPKGSKDSRAGLRQRSETF